jgi:hypothetical protein
MFGSPYFNSKNCSGVFSAKRMEYGLFITQHAALAKLTSIHLQLTCVVMSGIVMLMKGVSWPFPWVGLFSVTFAYCMALGLQSSRCSTQTFHVLFSVYTCLTF